MRRDCTRSAHPAQTTGSGMNELATTTHEIAGIDVMGGFGAFLRLCVADGDAFTHTISLCYGNAAQLVDWCAECGVHAATATETDLLRYRQTLLSIISRTLLPSSWPRSGGCMRQSYRGDRTRTVRRRASGNRRKSRTVREDQVSAA
jgi:hypothetical protein